MEMMQTHGEGSEPDLRYWYEKTIRSSHLLRFDTRWLHDSAHPLLPALRLPAFAVLCSSDSEV